MKRLALIIVAAATLAACTGPDYTGNTPEGMIPLFVGALLAL